MNGWQMICRQLQHLAVENVFGIPGSQNAELFSEITRTKIRIVTASSEKSAAFAAIGYAIGTGKPSVLLTIAGPGFCYTAAPLVEATHDSVPLVNIVIGDAEKPGRKFQLQAIDHEGLAGRLSKATRKVDDAKDLMPTLQWAWHMASSGEPGPVVVLVTSDLLNAEQKGNRPFDFTEEPMPPSAADLSRVSNLIGGKRVLILAGRGAVTARPELEQLVRNNDWALVTTASGRGILSEEDPSVIKIDGCTASAVNAIIEEFDFVLVIGAKLTHNGSFGFGLRLPTEKLVHIDASSEVLNANYEARVAIHCDAVLFCQRLLADLNDLGARPALKSLEKVRFDLEGSRSDELLEPKFIGNECKTAAEFFSTLQQVMPKDTIFVADSGYHQVLMRRHLVARHANQIVFPSDFQSMGFGLPVAIGLSLAHPSRTIAVIHGDGGFQMCAADLLTAVKEKLGIVVCVFDDGKYGLIRMQQLNSGNAESGVSLPALDYAVLAAAFGATYVDSRQGLESALRAACGSDGPVLLCQSIVDSQTRTARFFHAKTKGRLRRMVGPEIMAWVRSRRGQ